VNVGWLAASKWGYNREREREREKERERGREKERERGRKGVGREWADGVRWKQEN